MSAERREENSALKQIEFGLAAQRLEASGVLDTLEQMVRGTKPDTHFIFDPSQSDSDPQIQVTRQVGIRQHIGITVTAPLEDDRRLLINGIRVTEIPSEAEGEKPQTYARVELLWSITLPKNRNDMRIVLRESLRRVGILPTPRKSS